MIRFAQFATASLVLLAGVMVSAGEVTVKGVHLC